MNAETIIIDEEFQSLLPALDKETYMSLEQNILTNGCMFPLVLWGNTLIDGYNRYKICTEHDIPFQTIEKEFPLREAAMIWMISNQISRRNLNPIQLSYFRGLHYHADKKIVTNKGGNNQFSRQDEVVLQNEEQPESQSTVARLSNQ